MIRKLLLGTVLGVSLLPAVAQNNTEIPTLSCVNKTRELNTGYSGSQQLAAGASDNQWFVAQSRPGGNAPPTSAPASGWRAAVLPSAPSTVWVSTTGANPAFTDAAWLSPRADSQSADKWWVSGSSGEVANPYFNFYRTQFNLAPEVPPSALSIHLDYYVDDGVVGAFVNGVAQAGLPGAGYAQGQQGSFTFSSGWTTGLNTLVFSTQDVGWVTGFLARATVDESICTVSPVRVTKTADKTHYEPGEAATYTVTVTSLGLVPITGASLADPMPAGLYNGQWSCAASGGAACPSPVQPMPVSFDLPAQGALTFTLTGTVTGLASLDNTATITPGTGGVCAADTGCAATVQPTYTPLPPAVIAPQPDAGSAVAGTASTPVANIAANDQVNGQQAALGAAGNATVSTSGTWIPGITLDPVTGAVSTSVAVPAGVYALNYTLCDKRVPANCKDSTVTITVTAPTPAPTPVPALETWGLIGLSGLLAAAAARRRRK